MATEVWGSDVPISMPEPPRRPIMVNFGGFGMTTGGIAHNITEADIEEMFTPFFGPEHKVISTLQDQGYVDPEGRA
jgi:hypothetical protein